MLCLRIEHAHLGWRLERTADQLYCDNNRVLRSATNISGTILRYIICKHELISSTDLEMQVRENFVSITLAMAARYIRLKIGIDAEEDQDVAKQRGDFNSNCD